MCRESSQLLSTIHVEINNIYSITLYATINNGTHEKSVQQVVIKMHRNEITI